MANIKIVSDRETCIGCGACTALAPEYWALDDQGKASFKLNSLELELDEDELKKLLESAEGCPVNAIHIYKDGEKIL